jgi:hypothetical protein
MSKDQIKNLELTDMFLQGHVNHMLDGAVVMAAADQFFYAQEAKYRTNPANTFPYRALADAEMLAVLNIYAVLQDEEKLRPLNVQLRRVAELRLHRDAIGHPLVISKWHRKEGQQFYDEGRKYTDVRAALVWDMQRSLNDELLKAGFTPRNAAVTMQWAHAETLATILRIALKDPSMVPPVKDLEPWLVGFSTTYIAMLEKHPDSKVPDSNDSKRQEELGSPPK